jgi:hypothetical protein
MSFNILLLNENYFFKIGTEKDVLLIRASIELYLCVHCQNRMMISKQKTPSTCGAVIQVEHYLLTIWLSGTHISEI